MKKIIENFLYTMRFIVTSFIKFKRYDPASKIGQFLVLSGITISGLSFAIDNLSIFAQWKEQQFFMEIALSQTLPEITIGGFVIIIIGVGILLHRYRTLLKEQKNKKAFYYLKGFTSQAPELPFYALPREDQIVKPVKIPLEINTDEIEKLSDEYDYFKRIIMDHILQNKSDSIFFAGLGRIPFLYCIGACFRNAHSHITLLDHDHQQKKWFTLADTDDCNTELLYSENAQVINFDTTDVGIALEFTSQIPEWELPEKLQNKTLRFKLSTGFSHNQIKHAATASRIVDTIIKEILKITKKTNKKQTIHFFIAAQASITFELGRRYQDGMMGQVVIYNYNPQEKWYSWAILFDGKQIKVKKIKKKKSSPGTP